MIIGYILHVPFRSKKMKSFAAIVLAILFGATGAFCHGHDNRYNEDYYDEYDDGPHGGPHGRPHDNPHIDDPEIDVTIKAGDLYSVKGGKYKGGKSCTVSANYVRGTLDLTECPVNVTEVRFYDINDKLAKVWKSGKEAWKGGQAYELSNEVPPREEMYEMKLSVAKVFATGSLNEKNISCKDMTDIPAIFLVDGGEIPVCQKRYDSNYEHAEFVTKDQAFGISKDRIKNIPSRGENAVVGLCEFGYRWGKDEITGRDACVTKY